MPQYEYICEQDGEVITLLRPMREADAQVDDPSGRGRRFVRKLSAFGVAGTEAGAGSGHVHLGSCCPCGKPQSACGRN